MLVSKDRTPLIKVSLRKLQEKSSNIYKKRRNNPWIIAKTAGTIAIMTAKAIGITLKLLQKA